MSTSGNSFLHERNPNLHASPEVEHVAAYLRANGEAIPNQPEEKIAAYVGFLANEQYVDDGLLTGGQTSRDRQIEHHVVRAENIPEAYFELQRRIAREQGHGDIEITHDIRRQLTEAAQSEQRTGLATWVDYLNSEDGNYPDWFKLYVFGSLTKLGNFDKEKGEFQRRSKGTTAPYPDLNREALAYVYDKLKKSRIEGEEITGDALAKLVKGGNFAKLYVHAVKEVTPASEADRAVTEGAWVKYSQTHDAREAYRLAGSLQGHGTGWCTAGESTAQAQLQMGDFHVYYTRDDRGNNTIPRIAVRMAGGSVAEVRGINPSQELEPVMADITAERIKDLPGGDVYNKKAQDMKRLTWLERTLTENPNATLTNADLRFLYEIDNKIEGFGYDRDPRISQTRALRGERDYPVLGSLLRESLKDQVQVSYTAYTNVVDQLNSARGRWNRNRIAQPNPQEFMKILERKQAEWEESGAFDYLVERLVQDGARVQLVATPNIVAAPNEIKGLAREFGTGQPYETYIYDEMYDAYSAEELSGVATSAEPVRFMLMPTEYDDSLTGTQEQQLSRLQALRAKLPQLKVPSVLDAITYWQTLRAGGDKLDSPGAYSRTVMRHFDLPGKSLDGWRYVPARTSTMVAGRTWTTLVSRVCTTVGWRWGKIRNLFTSSFSFSFATI